MAGQPAAHPPGSWLDKGERAAHIIMRMTKADEWIGRVGDMWAAEWRRTDRAFAELTDRLVAAANRIAPPAGRAMDIGCGAGETSIAIAAAHPAIAVTGVDLSAGLIAAARERAGERANPAFLLGDAAQSATALAPVDLFVSRHGVMFFDDPGAAFAAFRAAAAPGARIVFSCFRDWSQNSFAHELGAIVGEGSPPPGAPGPFAFADRDDVHALLAGAGWRDARAEPVDFGYRAGAGDDAVADAVDFLSRIGPAARALRAAPDAGRPAIRDRIAAVCAAHLNGNAVDFPSAAWIWTASAGEEPQP